MCVRLKFLCFGLEIEDATVLKWLYVALHQLPATTFALEPWGREREQSWKAKKIIWSLILQVVEEREKVADMEGHDMYRLLQAQVTAMQVLSELEESVTTFLVSKVLL